MASKEGGTFPSCTQDVLLLNRSEEYDDLPPYFVGRECPPPCSRPHWSLEVPRGHALAACIRHADAAPVISVRVVLDGPPGWPRQFVEAMAACRARGRRAHWLLRFLRVRPAGMVAEDVQAYHLLCAPRACSNRALAGYFGPLAAMGELEDGPLDWKPLDPLPEEYASSRPCRPGCVGLPPRFAAPLAEERALWEWMGGSSLADQITFIPTDSGPRFFWTAEQRLPPRLQPERSTLPQPDAGAAIIFAGDWRLSRRGAASIRRHLIEPLDALVIAVISGAPGSSGAGERAALAAAFGEDRLAEFEWFQDPSPEELREELDAGGNVGLYKALGSDLFLPLHKERGQGGGALLALRKLEQALRLAERCEARRGRRFAWLVASRTDLMWRASHPPLELLDPRAIWITVSRARSSEEANYRANDWHAAVPRGLAPAYFRRWSALAEGGLPVGPFFDPMQILRANLDLLGVPMGRFPAMAGLERCKDWQCLYKAWFRNASAPIPWRTPEEAREIMGYARGLRQDKLAWAPAEGELGPELRIVAFASNSSFKHNPNIGV